MIPSISGVIDQASHHNSSYALRISNLDPAVLNMADRFYELLPAFYKHEISINSLTVTGFLTVTIDWATSRKDFVCVEIACEYVNFYSDLQDGSMPEGSFHYTKPEDMNEIPKPILMTLEKLYGKSN